MVTVHNFSEGLLTPVLAYLMSCLGCFLGLQCTSRATALAGRSRARWLLLGAVSIGTTGIWVMHFIAMLGYTIPGQTIRYNVIVTILSMIIAVVVVTVGLLIVGFRPDGLRPLLLGGAIIGLGVASMHYMGMYAIRVPDSMSFQPLLVVLSVVIAIVAGNAALWAALRLRGLGAMLAASAIMGVAVSGMHYTGMASMHMSAAAPGGGMAAMGGGGATAGEFLLPLILGISTLAFLVTAVITLSPSEAEIREDAALMSRLSNLPGHDPGSGISVNGSGTGNGTPVSGGGNGVASRRETPGYFRR